MEDFTIEKATEMINQSVAELKGSFTPEIKAQIDALKNELLTEIKGKITESDMEKKFNEFQVKLDEFAEKFKPVSTKSKVQLFADELNPTVEELKSGAQSVKMEVKSISATELVMPNFNTNVDPNAKMPQLRTTSLLDLIPKMPLVKRNEVTIALSSTAYCNYQDEGTVVNVTNSAGAAAETTFSASKIKIRANGISKEALLEDTPTIVQKILSDLSGKSRIFLEGEVIDGLGATGTPKKIWGIIPQFSTAFDSTTIGTDDLVDYPNLYDLAKAAKLQATISPDDRTYNSNTVVVHPLRLFELSTAKDQEGRPLMVDGLLMGVFNVVASRALETSEMLLVDPTVFTLYVGRDWEMEIKQDSYPVVSEQNTTFYSDADHDTYSMIGFFRGMLTMNMADKAGNIYIADIDTALADLKKPVA